MSADKKIVKVTLGDRCLESYPCQHDITIAYEDGSTVVERTNGKEVCQKYYELLSDKDKAHVECYKEKRIVKVDLGEICLQSYPCQHSITITYEDGTTVVEHVNGRKIYEKYYNFLSDKEKTHVIVYK